MPVKLPYTAQSTAVGRQSSRTVANIWVKVGLKMRSLDRVPSTIDPRQFYEKYVHTRTPCIISSPAALFEDVNIEWRERLSLDSWMVRQEFLDSTVIIEQKSNVTGTFGTDHLPKLKMKMRQFLAILSRRDEDTGDSLYLTTQYEPEDNKSTENDGHQILPQPIPALISEFIPLIPHLLPTLVPQQINLWMGRSREGTSSGLHHDYHDNIYVLLRGRKRFCLFPPSDQPFLYTYGYIHHMASNGLITYYHDDFDERRMKPMSSAIVDRMMFLSNSANKIRSDGADKDDVLEWELKCTQKRYNRMKRQLERERNGKGSTTELTLLQSQLYNLARQILQNRDASDFSEFFEEPARDGGSVDGSASKDYISSSLSDSSDSVEREMFFNNLCEETSSDENDADFAIQPLVDRLLEQLADEETVNSSLYSDAEENIPNDSEGEQNGQSSVGFAELSGESDSSIDSDDFSSDSDGLNRRGSDESGNYSEESEDDEELLLSQYEEVILTGDGWLKKRCSVTSDGQYKRKRPKIAIIEEGQSDDLVSLQQDISDEVGEEMKEKNSDNQSNYSTLSSNESQLDDSRNEEDEGPTFDQLPVLSDTDFSEGDDEELCVTISGGGNDSADESESEIDWEAPDDYDKLEKDDPSKATNVRPSKEPPSFSRIPVPVLHQHLIEKGILSPADVAASAVLPCASSPVDFPHLNRAHPLVVELKAGEMLYLPASWFHEVSSFSGEADGSELSAVGSNLHLAINYWFHPPTQPDFQQPYEDDYWKEYFKRKIM